MIKSKFLILAVLSLLSIAAFGSPSAASSADLQPAQLTIRVIQPPDPMVAYGKAYLVYELLITNYDSSTVKVRSLRITDPNNDKVAFDFSGKRLNEMTGTVGRGEGGQNITTLESGVSRLMYVWLEFNSASEVPRQLAQFVGYQVDRGGLVDGEIAAPLMTVDDSPPVTIGPPLQGGDWLVNGGPSNTSYHRRAHMALGGVLKFAQRFAIDYVKIASDGKTYSGDPKQNKSYYCYGAKVIAVANGRVVAIHDGIPENIPDPVKRAVKMTLATAGGNYVALYIGYGRYALYGHLIPGSIVVKRGELVKRGQLLARLGNSGNSTEPHLHFQIADAPSFLDANGLPYLYARVAVRPSRVVRAEVDPPVVQITGPPRDYLSTMLLENQVVVFPR